MESLLQLPFFILMLTITWWSVFKSQKVSQWLKSDFGWILLVALIGLSMALSSCAGSYIFKNYFPWNSDYGIEKNDERKSKGIPIIEKDWEYEPAWSNQFRKWYTGHDQDRSHKKKMVKFDNWGAISESDFYRSEKGECLLMKYDYDSESVLFFISEINSENDYLLFPVNFDQYNPISEDLFNAKLSIDQY